jgi:hypothetical protein
MGFTRRRVQSVYGLDLDVSWPRLWLIIPEGSRAAFAPSRRASPIRRLAPG